MINFSGFKKIVQFQKHLSGYKIIVCDGLSRDRVLLSGKSFSNKILPLLYDSEHYSIIKNLKAVMAKRYTCNACDTI